MRERVGKVAKTLCFFQWFGGSGGVEKVGSLKVAGAEPAGQMRDEKLHAVVGAKHISKSKMYKKHTMVGALFGTWWCRKKCTPLWREAHFQVKMHKKHTMVGALLGRGDVEKSARHCVAKHISKSKMYKNTPWGGTLFGTWRCPELHYTT